MIKLTQQQLKIAANACIMFTILNAVTGYFTNNLFYVVMTIGYAGLFFYFDSKIERDKK